MRIDFPNIRILAFQDYNHYLMDIYYDLTNSFYKFNLRLGLTSSICNASLIVHDDNNVIGNGEDLIFKITIIDNRTGEIEDYVMGSSHNDLTIMQNGDAVRTYNLVPYHNRIPKRFNVKLTNNASESIEILLDDLYNQYTLIKPDVESVDVYVPSAIWVLDFPKYLEFINRKGLSSSNDMFVFTYYGPNKIIIEDYETIINKEPIKGLFVEEELVGRLGELMGENIPVFKYEFMTESNNYNIKDKMNSSYISTSTEKNGSYLEIVGDGDNIISIDRSCIYREMTYANGFEEINRLVTLNQYDSYGKFRTYGDIRLRPGNLIEIEDAKGLIKNVNIIDEVLIEFSQEFVYTHVYTMSHSKEIQLLEVDKEINMEGENFPQEEILDEEEEEMDE